MAVVPRTLDIPEMQILAEFPGERLDMHHRILWYRVDRAVWIISTPDHDVYEEDFDGTTVVSLGRNSLYPADQAGRMYIPDNDDIMSQYAELKRQADALAVIRGCVDRPGVTVSDGVQTDAHWRVADVDSKRFGEIIPPGDLLDGSCNVILKVGEVQKRLHLKGDEILTLELVKDFTSWSERKRPGLPGGDAGDLRLLGCSRLSSGKRQLPLTEALTKMADTKFEDWPHRGPKATREFLESVAENGGDLANYHSSFMRKSGLSENSAASHEYKNLLGILKLAVSYDQVDCSNLASIEQVVRRILEIQVAVRRNPKHPTFDSFDYNTRGVVDEVGGARAAGYAEWMAEQQKAEAKALKSTREWRQEQATERKKSHKDQDRDSSDDDGAAKPDWLQRRARSSSILTGNSGSHGFSRRQIGRVREAVDSLNSLGCSTATSVRRGVFDLGHRPRGIATAPQQSALQRIGRRIKESGGCPKGLNPRMCFEDVMKSKDMYSLNQSAVAPYSPDLLKVTKSNTVPKEATKLLPPTEANFLLHPDEHLVKSPEEIEAWMAEHGDFQPYWDETLRGSREARLDLYRKLASKSLLGFRRRIRTKVGIFFVWKSEKRGIRLIIDARMPNGCHRRPPKTKLGGAAGLSEIDAVLDADDLDTAACGYGGAVELPAKLFGDTGDVSDAFYQFSVWPLAEWFGLDDPVFAHEFDVNEVWNPDTQAMEGVAPDEPLFPVFLGMPQGWAWALHFCNTAVEFGMSKSIPSASFIKDGMTTPDPKLGPLGSVYVDNLGVFGFAQQVVHHSFDMAVENLERAGFVFHELEKGSTEVTNVGVVIDTQRRRLRHSRKRSWRLYLALKHFLRLKKATGESVRVLAGHIVHYFSIQRAGMSCLHHTYKFIYQWLDGRSHIVPGAVKREIRMVVGMIFQVDVDLSAPYSPIAFCGDSSSYGYCFQVTNVQKSEQRDLFRFHERWRFIEVEDGIGLGLGSHHSWSADFKVPQTSYVRWLCERLGMVPKLPDSLLEASRWKTLVKRRWDHSEPIHLKEGRVALMSLRRAARNATLHGHRLLTLCDNLSAIMAYDKGRARDLSLLSLCRRAGALQLACEIRWHLRFVESARNPSDKDSRAFSHPFRRKYRSQIAATVRERVGTVEAPTDRAASTRGTTTGSLPSCSTSARGRKPTVISGRGSVVAPHMGAVLSDISSDQSQETSGVTETNRSQLGSKHVKISGRPADPSLGPMPSACYDSEGPVRGLFTGSSQSSSPEARSRRLPRGLRKRVLASQWQQSVVWNCLVEVVV
eukprot:s1272_g4.t1